MNKKATTEKHLGMPWKEWQTKKRQEWREVQSALSRFAFGAAYTPAGGDLYTLQQAAERIAEAMKEDWVSW